MDCVPACKPKGRWFNVGQVLGVGVVHERQPHIDVSLHLFLSLFPSLPLSKNKYIKILFKKESKTYLVFRKRRHSYLFSKISMWSYTKEGRRTGWTLVLPPGFSSLPMTYLHLPFELRPQVTMRPRPYHCDVWRVQALSFVCGSVSLNKPIPIAPL